MNKKRKKYNDQTGHYKIDIFNNGIYVCSTAWSKTCKEAVTRYRDKWEIGPTEKITAFFDYQ